MKTSADQLDIQALLGREEHHIDMSNVAAMVQGETVLVTGAGGSIGSEVCRQLLNLKPKRLLLLGHGEYAIYSIYQHLITQSAEVICVPIIANVQDKDRIMAICKMYAPSFICHTAAYKHVPLMEMHPQEAVNNNIYGTAMLLDVASQLNISHFCLVSSDKAVYPTSVMGATKRIAELLVSATRSATQLPYVSVRFGNVLHSKGSVIPLFCQQLQSGGPLTLTDKQMMRYFMTAKEATQLVLSSFSVADQADLFVWDMGAPIRIFDLAQRLIQHYAPHQSVDIIEIGKRPGEKIREVYLTDKEFVRHQVDDRLFMGQTNSPNLQSLRKWLQTLPSVPEGALKNTLIDYCRVFEV